MIIATAGHVDHGKTTLVQALTGINTDGLAEEQRRGMTIEPGFAVAEWADGDSPAPQRLGFVDVPGHERFVRNMLAVVHGVDLGLLVVAADDGPMPQTHEHLAILQLLAVPQLALVLSKVDRVSPQRLQQVHREMDALLAAGPYTQAPRFEVVAPRQQGLPALRQHLAQAARLLARRPVAGHFRMAVDRSFSISGAGRVITGVVLSGQVHVGDELRVSPSGVAVRVRGVQQYQQAATAASAGQRCALNLSGAELKRSPPQRGDWVLAAAAHRPTQRLDVWLRVLASEAAPLSPRSALQLHLGAAVVNAHATPLTPQGLLPGSVGLVQLRLDQPVAAAHGDRFILREPAGNRSVAGGWVVDPFAAAPGRRQALRLDQLAAMQVLDPAQALCGWLALAPDGVDLDRFAQARNLLPDEAHQLHQTLSLKTVPGTTGLLGLSPTHWQTWRERVLAALAAWHARHPDSLGPQPGALRRALDEQQRPARPTSAHTSPADAAHRVMQGVLAELVQEGQVSRNGLCHHLPAHRPSLNTADQDLLARVSTLLQPAGLRPPIVGELATQLGLPRDGLLDQLARLAAQGQLVHVAPNRFYLPDTATELLQQAQVLAARQPAGRFDAASYRDHTGIGRNLTVQVLEFFRREGLTHFDGTHHRLLS